MMIVHRIILRKERLNMPKKTEEKNNKGKKQTTKTSASNKVTKKRTKKEPITKVEVNEAPVVKKEKFPPACLLIHISLCQIFFYLFSPHPLFLVVFVLNCILQASTETSLLSKTFLQPSA